MSTEFTKTVRGASLLERIFIRSMVVLLKIEATGAANERALGFYRHMGYLNEDVTLVKLL